MDIGIEALVKQIQEGALLTEEQKEAVYAQGFHAFSQQLYEEASHIFAALVVVAPLVGKYWKGFAASFQTRGLYAQALRGWGMLVLLEEEEAESHFRAAECLFLMGQKEEALKALNLAQEKAGSYKELEEKIDLLRKAVCQKF